MARNRVVIKGYTSDGHYIVNDPYGSYPYAAGLCGDYDGADVWYTWDQMKVGEKWMVKVSKNAAPTDKIGVFRNGGLYFDKNGDGYWSTGDTTGWFGATGDRPVVGDWDGNGKDEIAIFRNGGWYFDKNGDGYWSTGDTTGWFGISGDKPLAGYWN